MIKATLKYLVFDPDENDNPRYYVRRPGRKKIRIRETFRDAGGNITPEFLKAYFAALEILESPSLPKTPRKETFYWLVDQYYRSSEFGALDPITQGDKRRVLNRFCQTAGNLPFAAYRKEDVERSRDKRREKPGAADKLVKCLRALFAWAIEKNSPEDDRKKLATFNPALGVKKISETKGWHTWTRGEVAVYRAHHPIGTKARLALELMITVGARISDAAQIGRQHEADGWLKFVAWKNRKKKSRKIIECLIRPELAEALAVTPTGDLTYIVNDLGQPFTIHGLGNKMRDWCDAAGLPQCSAHGLRKAAAVILAESGASASELCALFGWSKLETAEVYIREANKRTMVENVFTRLDEHRKRKSVSVSGPKSETETKTGNNDGKSKGK